MILRFTLSHDIEGDYVISEPDGWREATIGFERHKDFHSLIEYFKGSFNTYGSNGSEDGGRDWLKNIERLYGVDADINILVEIDYDEEGIFAEVFSGQVAVEMFVESLNTQHLLQIVFTQNDFWTRFMNRYQSQIDVRSTVDLDGNVVVPAPKFTLPLPAQIITKKYQSEQKFNQAVDFSNGTTDWSSWSQGLQIDFDTLILGEIDETFNYGLNPILPSTTIKTLPFAKFILAEDGDLSIDDFKITLSTIKLISAASPSPVTGKENRTFSTLGFFNVFIQVNGGAKINCAGSDRIVAGYNRNDGKVISLYTNTVTDYSYSGILLGLKKNDQVRIYAELITDVNFGFWYDVEFALPYSDIKIRSLFVWGSQGWNKDNFCPLMGGESFVPFGLTDPFIDMRYTSLISAGYDPSTDVTANAITGFPVYEDDAFTKFIYTNDSWIVSNAGNIGSGSLVQPISKGDYIQVAFTSVRQGTISCNAGSAIITGTGTNFTNAAFPLGSCVYAFGAGVAANPTSLIGQVLSVDSTTQITLAVNASVTYANKSFGSIFFYVNSISLYQGLEAFGDTHLNVTFNSVVPDSSTDAFLTHDVASAITDRIAGQSGLFYSKYLGNPFTVREYDDIGCASLLANMKGLHLRGYKLEGNIDPTKNKPFFQSMQDWWDGINPIHNLGLGYEKIGEDNVIRVERKEYFYDDSEFSIKLSNVQKITCKYDSDVQFSSVKNGYEKWQSQAANGVGTPSGIDDGQTVQTRNSRFKKVGKLLTILSKWIAASLTIETTRRVGNLLSANYTYDDDTFVIALKNDGGDFTPELDENFSSITNLSNSASRYNSRLTPARNFLRWLNYLAGCLQDYSTSFFKFASGEGNYTMTSTMTTSCEGDESGESIAENGDIEVGTDFLHLSQLYDIEHELDWNDYLTFRERKRFALGISQTEDDHKKFMIKDFDYQFATGILKIQAWAKEPFEIQVIDSPASEGIYYSNRFYEPEYEPEYE